MQDDSEKSSEAILIGWISFIVEASETLQKSDVKGVGKGGNMWYDKEQVCKIPGTEQFMENRGYGGKGKQFFVHRQRYYNALKKHGNEVDDR